MTSKSAPKLQENAHNALSTHSMVIRSCACGCGLTFEPKREWQIYLNTEHRQRANSRRRPADRQAIKRTTELLLEALATLRKIEGDAP